MVRCSRGGAPSGTETSQGRVEAAALKPAEARHMSSVDLEGCLLWLTIGLQLDQAGQNGPVRDSTCRAQLETTANELEDAALNPNVQRAHGSSKSRSS